MEFRCRKFSPTYHAIEFLSNLEESRQVIEVLQCLNHLEYFMSLNDYFENDKNKGKVAYCYDPMKIETEHTDINLIESKLLKDENADSSSFAQAKAMGMDGKNGREIRYVEYKKPLKKKQYEDIE